MKRHPSKLSLFRDKKSLAPVSTTTHPEYLNSTDESTGSSTHYEEEEQKGTDQSQSQMDSIFDDIQRVAKQPGESLVLYIKKIAEESREQTANQLMKELKSIANTFEPSPDQMVVHKVMSYINSYCSLWMQKFFDTNLRSFPSVSMNEIKLLPTILPNFSDLLRMPKSLKEIDSGSELPIGNLTSRSR